MTDTQRVNWIALKELRDVLFVDVSWTCKTQDDADRVIAALELAKLYLTTQKAS